MNEYNEWNDERETLGMLDPLVKGSTKSPEQGECSESHPTSVEQERRYTWCLPHASGA